MNCHLVRISQLLVLTAGAGAAPVHAQPIPTPIDDAPSDYHYQCPPYAYLPLAPESINGWEVADYWLEPEVETLPLDVPPEIEPGSIVMVRFDFLIDSMGCPRDHRITESSGFDMLDEAILEVLADFQYTPADRNVDRRAVFVTGGAFGFGVPKNETRYGTLEGALGEAEFQLDGVYVDFRPDRNTNLCNFSLWSTPMDAHGIGFLKPLPCVDNASLVGREYHFSGTEEDFSLRVSTNFVFDEQRTGGSYRTYWEGAEPEFTRDFNVLRFTGFDGQYLTGELHAQLRARMHDGTVVRDIEIVQFTASFRARVEE